MISIKRILLLCLSCTSAKSANRSEDPLVFHIPDGTKRNSYIGNLPQNAKLNAPSDEYLRNFVIVTGEKLITISANGDIRTSRDIDRETLCQRLNSECSFDAEIIATPKEFRLFKVVLIVDDLNDNSPIFPNQVIQLSLAENAKIGTFLRLDSATDADTPAFAISSYELDDVTEFFRLVQEDIVGSLVPQLELMKSLSFEKRPQHVMTLTAVDRGDPPRLGTAQVIVNVIDVNDHSPIFVNDRIQCNIPEDLAVGDVVTILNATDADHGENSRITYTYQDTLVSEELRERFKLDHETGRITIGQKLDFEKWQSHILYIKAEDNGPNSVPTYATVIINIIDVNDNRPEITVAFIDDDEDSNVHYISEDIAVGEFLAFVSVTDRDANERGRNLRTELEESDDFELITVDEKNNRYILQTKQLLDRERKERYELTIKSIDNGDVKRLRSIKNIPIVLKDVNDNAPYFPHGQYHVSVVENNEVGKIITQLLAHDLDSGENSRITYTLAKPSENFKINPVNGEIVALTSLDAEKLREPELLEILARDNGTPSLTGTTALRISIKDFNDNAPIFIKKRYQFEIVENLPNNFIIGQVEAIDGDLVRDLNYKIIQDYDVFPFGIDPVTGKIFVTSKLDYEGEHRNFKFKAQAIDKDGFNDLANVTVKLLDENDNAPRVKYPHPSKHIVWIKPSLQPGQVITTVQVSDPDSGSNGIVNFEIEGGSGIYLVKINQQGEMILQKELSEEDYGKYSVFLRISDKGKIQRFTSVRINLMISEERFDNAELPALLREYHTELAMPTSPGVSELALLLVATFSALIFILLLFTICIYCRRRRSKRREVQSDFSDHVMNTNNLGNSNRHEDAKMVNWSELKNGTNASDRSYHSGQSGSGSCTRDSGAGDSVESEFCSIEVMTDHNLPLIYHSTKFSPPDFVHRANSNHPTTKPTFTTFMGDSDTDSVQFVDYNRVNA